VNTRWYLGSDKRANDYFLSNVLLCNIVGFRRPLQLQHIANPAINTRWHLSDNNRTKQPFTTVIEWGALKINSRNGKGDKNQRVKLRGNN
jgi:hypothetical protein